MSKEALIGETPPVVLSEIWFELREKSPCKHFLANSIHERSDARSGIEKIAIEDCVTCGKLSIETMMEGL